MAELTDPASPRIRPFHGDDLYNIASVDEAKDPVKVCSSEGVW